MRYRTRFISVDTFFLVHIFMFKNYHSCNEPTILHSKTFPLPVTIESGLFRFFIKLKTMMFTCVNKVLKCALNIHLKTGKICLILMFIFPENNQFSSKYKFIC